MTDKQMEDKRYYDIEKVLTNRYTLTGSERPRFVVKDAIMGGFLEIYTTVLVDVTDLIQFLEDKDMIEKWACDDLGYGSGYRINIFLN